MAAIRHAIETIYIPLDLSCEFHGKLPQRFLEDESTSAERVESLWHQHFCPTISDWCRRFPSKQNFLEYGLQNICNDFSRRTENVKVRLYKEEDESSAQKMPHTTKVLQLLTLSKRKQRNTMYCLKLIRLSAVPPRVRRSQQFCCAEIPDLQEAKQRKIEEMCTMTVDEHNLIDANEVDEKVQEDEDNEEAVLYSATDERTPEDITNGRNADDDENCVTSSFVVQLSPHAPNGNRLVPAFCAICLSDYTIGDLIVHSSNPSCRHVFHSECLNRWLQRKKAATTNLNTRHQRNKDCPCCRENFWKS